MDPLTSNLDVDEIQTLMITKLCEDGVRLGQDSVLWQHPMNKTVKDYCKSKGYTVSGLVGYYFPAKYGAQYLITF